MSLGVLEMGCFVVARFLLTSTSRGPSELLVGTQAFLDLSYKVVFSGIRESKNTCIYL